MIKFTDVQFLIMVFGNRSELIMVVSFNSLSSFRNVLGKIMVTLRLPSMCRLPQLTTTSLNVCG